MMMVISVVTYVDKWFQYKIRTMGEDSKLRMRCGRV